MRRTLLPLALLLPAVAAGNVIYWVAGQDVFPALYIDVTTEGLQQVEPIAQTVLPPTVDLDVDGSIAADRIGIVPGLLDIAYDVSLANIFISPRIESLDLIPGPETRYNSGPPLFTETGAVVPGTITFGTELRADLASPSDPANVSASVSAGFLGLFDINIASVSCDFHAPNIGVALDLGVSLGVPVDRNRRIEKRCDDGTYTWETDDRTRLLPDEIRKPTPPAGYSPTCTGAVRPEFSLDGYEWEILDGNNDGTVDLDDLNISCGGFIDLILDVAQAVGIDPVEIALASFEPTIDATIEDLFDDLGPTVNDALGALTIEQSLDLAGATLDVSIGPSDFFLSEDGLRIEFAGGIDPGDFPNPCVARFDDDRSLGTLPPSGQRYPLLGDAFDGFTPQIAITANDDLLNQAFYALWRQGLLCQTISGDESPIELPIPLDSSLLNLVSSQGFKEFLPTTQPLILATRPEQPPLVALSDNPIANPEGIPVGDSTAGVAVQDLGIDLYSEIDGRMVRFVGLDLDITATADITFNNAAGTLGIGVNIGDDSFAPTVVFNDLKPEASAAVEGAFAGLLGDIVPGLLGDVLSGIEIPVPSFALDLDGDGVPVYLGIQALEVASAGPGRDFAGIAGAVGPVTYGSAGAAGCDLAGGSGGCDVGTGCDAGGGLGGCATPAGRWSLPLLVLTFGVLRRRRR